MNWQNLVVQVVVGILTIGLIVYIISIIPNDLSRANTYIQCCGRQVCSDTYYEYKTNLCHLSLCEKTPWSKNCTYEGKNISVDLR